MDTRACAVTAVSYERRRYNLQKSYDKISSCLQKLPDLRSTLFNGAIRSTGEHPVADAKGCRFGFEDAQHLG